MQQERVAEYYCHTCRRVVAPTPALACAVCGNDFLELVEDPDLATFVPFDAQQQQPSAQQPTPQQPRQQQPQPQHPPLNPMQQMLDNMVRALGGGEAANMPRPVVLDLQQLLGGLGAGGAGGGLGNIFQMLGVPLANAGAANMGDFVADANLQNVLNRLFEQSGSEARGADPEVVAALPLEQIGPADEGEDCPVCKETYAVGEEVKCMPCHHRFHVDCLDPWLKMKNNCPVCRFELKHKPKGDGDEQPAAARRPPAAVPARPPAPEPIIRRNASPEPPTPSDSEDEDSGGGDGRKKTQHAASYDDMYL